MGLGALSAPDPAAAAVYNATDPIDSYDVDTLRGAVMMANNTPEDDAILMSGTHELSLGSLTIEDAGSLIIIGAPQAAITSAGNPDTLIFNDGGSDLTLQRVTVAGSAQEGILSLGDLTLVNGAVRESANNGVYMLPTGQLEVRDSDISHNGQAGILNISYHSSISGSNIHDNGGAGILNWENEEVVIGSCEIFNNIGYGIENNGAEKILISSTLLENNEAGLYSMESDTEISDSAVRDNNTHCIYDMEGDLLVSGSQVSGCRYGLYNFASTVLLENSSVSQNTDVGFGNFGQGVSGITGSTFSQNGIGLKNECPDAKLAVHDTEVEDSTDYGIESEGELELENSSVINSGIGGLNLAGRAEISGSKISGNGTVGIRAEFAELRIKDATIDGNGQQPYGYDAGGIFARHCELELDSSAVTNNHNKSPLTGGGGLSLAGVEARILNSTVSGNAADSGGGGIMAKEHYAKDSEVLVESSTVADNKAGDPHAGGGILNASTNQEPVFLKNTIVSGNINLNSPDISGAFESQDHNIINDTAGATLYDREHDLLNVDPMLGPLALNSGKTRTHSLLPGSPAIDHIPETMSVNEDQRHYARGQLCDVGAFEVKQENNGKKAKTRKAKRLR